MKKFVIAILPIIALVLLLPLIGKAQSVEQTVTYQIDLVRPDSFYLAETIGKTIENSPRNQEVTTYKLFRDTAELNEFRRQLLVQAAEYQKQANQYLQAAAFIITQEASVRAVQEQKFGPIKPATKPEAPATSPPKTPPTKPATTKKTTKKKKS